MNTLSGYSKKTLTDSKLLLAAGGDMSLSSLVGSVSWDSTNKKIQYTPYGGTAIDVVTLQWSNIKNAPQSLPANGGNADTTDNFHFTTWGFPYLKASTAKTTTTLKTLYVTILLSAFSAWNSLGIRCSYNNAWHNLRIYKLGFANGVMVIPENLNGGVFTQICYDSVYHSTTHKATLYLQLKPILDSTTSHYSPSSEATVYVYGLETATISISQTAPTLTNGKSWSTIGTSVLITNTIDTLISWSNVISKPNLVNTVGGQAGAITVRGGLTANGSVNLTMSGKEIQASIVGLGSNAYSSTSYLPLSGTGDSTNGTDPTSVMKGPVWFKNVDGIKINSNNTDRKIWEVVGNSGSYARLFGFHLEYKGTASNNDKDLILWAHNRAGTYAEVYRVHLDGSFIFKSLPKVGSDNIALAKNYGTAATHAHTDYVTSIGTSGNTLTWSKGGTALTAITVPYATNSGTVGGKSASEFLYINRLTNTVPSHNYIGTTSLLAAVLGRVGYPLFTDPEFASGKNSCSFYSRGVATGSAEVINDAQHSGNSSGKILKITTTSTENKNYSGGFDQVLTAADSKIKVQIFRAKLPSGYLLAPNTNSQGTGAYNYWLTSDKGTGKWEWYIYVWCNGYDGTFSTGGHFSLYKSGACTGTEVWYVSYANIYDITNGSYDGLRTRYADSATGITGYTFKTLSGKSHSGWINTTTDNKIITTQSFIAYWNGAYNSSGNSNLSYCNLGAFGSATTHAHSDYVTGLSISGNTLAWSKGGTAQTALTIPYATKAGKAEKAIKFKKTNGTAVSYDGSTEVDLTDGVNYATTSGKLNISKSTTLDTNSTDFYVDYAGGSNNVVTKPTGVDAFGCMHLRTADGWYGEILLSSDAATGLYYRTATSLTSSTPWVTLLDSKNSSVSGQTITINGTSTTWANNAHTTFKWTDGTSAGPTGSLSGNDHTAVSFPAIPSASASISGIVTTGALTFAGAKTFKEVVHLRASQYTDSAGTGSLNLNNSDIYGVNSIKFADLSDSAAEGLQWYRDSTHVDSLWVQNGVIYFTPNREWGKTGTNHTLIHSGNYTTYCAPASHTHSYLPLSGGTMTGAIGMGSDATKWLITTGTSGATSPLRGIKMPATSSNWLGLFARPSKGTDEGGLLLSEDTCIIYNSFGTGYGLAVYDTDMNLSDWSGNLTFGVNTSYRAWARGGFVKDGSSDSYVLLGGGGHALISSLSVASSASADKTKAALTFNGGGSGMASGGTFDGSSAKTVSYNTIGAAPEMSSKNYLNTYSVIYSNNTSGFNYYGEFWFKCASAVSAIGGKLYLFTIQCHSGDDSPQVLKFELLGNYASSATTTNTQHRGFKFVLLSSLMYDNSLNGKITHALIDSNNNLWFRYGKPWGSTDKFQRFTMTITVQSNTAITLLSLADAKASLTTIKPSPVNDISQIAFKTVHTALYSPYGILDVATLYENGTSLSSKYLGINANATSASKLNNTSAIGSSTLPVYFTSSGVPATCDLSTTYAPYNSKGYLPLSGGYMDAEAQIYFKGSGGSTSAYTKIGYGDYGPMFCPGNVTQTKGFYIMSNGYDTNNDWGGIAIDNEGVTVFGAGDGPASGKTQPFTGVFRVLNEDNVADGPQFLVTKASGAIVKRSLTASNFTSNVATGTLPYATTSTTLNTNLNADLLDGKHASDFATSGHNHNSAYVSALSTNGNYLTWTKNGSTNNITVPYATNAGLITAKFRFANDSVSDTRYVLLSEGVHSSSWNGAFYTMRFTGRETFWSGTLYVGYRTLGTPETVSADAHWNSLSILSWAPNVIITSSYDSSAKSNTVRVYLKLESAYKYTSVSVIESFGNITYGTGTILTSIQGTTLVTSSIVANPAYDSSVSGGGGTCGSSLTVKINGTSKTLTIPSTYAWSLITGKPSTFTPASHTHSQYLLQSGNKDSGQLVIYSTEHSSGTVYGGGIQIREKGAVTTSQTAWEYAPRITFHWGGRCVRSFGLNSSGNLCVNDTAISLNGHTHTKANITDFPTSLPASDVYDWAKAKTKPSYSFSEISGTIGNELLPKRLLANSSVTAADPNTFADSGFYYANTGTRPTNITDINVLLIAHTSSSWRHLLAFKFSGSGGTGTGYDGKDLWTRTYNASSKAWTPWYKILTDGNFVAGTHYASASHTHSQYLTAHQSLANYVTLDGTLTISGAKIFTSTSLMLSSHLYRSIHDASGNVYDHYYGGGAYSPNLSFANLRVKNGSSYKTLRFGGDGTFTWDGTAVSLSGHTHSQYLTAHQSVTNKAVTLAWNTSTTIATIGNTDITVKLPANPDTWRDITDSYSGTADNISLSQKGANALYSALLNGYANSAGNADTATVAGGLYANGSLTTDPGNYNLYYNRFLKDSACTMPVSDNANAALTIKLHDGNYYTLLGFSSNGRLYERHFHAEALNTTKNWNTIAWVSDIPTTLPASDVYAWAKESTKPSYTYSEVGAAAASHTHADYVTSIGTSGNTLTWAKNGTTNSITIPYASSAGDADTVDGKHASYFATSGHTHSYSDVGAASASHTHTTIVGSYTSNGGLQGPGYFGKNRVGALMMNTTINRNSLYKDFLFMDCYSNTDVGGGVAIGVNRQSLGAYIMRSDKDRAAWVESAELIGTHNYEDYCATASHTHTYSEVGAAAASHTHYWANISTSSSSSTATTPLFGKIGVGTTINDDYTITTNGTVYTSKGFKSGNVLFTHNESYIELASGGNEIVISGSATNMYVNYRGSTITGKKIPIYWYWNAGTLDTWVNHLAGHYYEASDIRLKTNLELLTISSKELSNIPLFDFDWVNQNTGRNTGTSALAVLAILPNLVSGEDTLHLDYGVLGTIAGVTACKELVSLREIIEKQQEEINTLKDKISELENKLNK